MGWFRPPPLATSKKTEESLLKRQLFYEQKFLQTPKLGKLLFPMARISLKPNSKPSWYDQPEKTRSGTKLQLGFVVILDSGRRAPGSAEHFLPY